MANNPFLSDDVFETEEYKIFAKKFDISPDAIFVEINLPSEDGCMEITQKYIAGNSDIHADVGDAYDSYQVYSEPEFKNLCKRLGIAWDLGTKAMVITIERGCAVLVRQTYLPWKHDND